MLKHVHGTSVVVEKQSKLVAITDSVAVSVLVTFHVMQESVISSKDHFVQLGNTVT